MNITSHAAPAAPIERLLEKTVESFNNTARITQSVRPITVTDLTADHDLSLKIPPYMYWRAATMLYATQDMGMPLDDVLAVFQGDRKTNEALIDRTSRAMLHGGMPIHEPYAKAYKSLCRHMGTIAAIQPPRPDDIDDASSAPASDETIMPETNTPVAPGQPQDGFPAIEMPETVPVIPVTDEPDFSTRQIKLAVLQAWNKLNFTSVTLKDIDSQARSRRIVTPRQFSMYATKILGRKHSLPEIGRHHGNRDHTTVLHSLRKINALISAQDPASTAFLKAISVHLGCTAEMEQKLLAGVSIGQPPKL